MTIETTRRKPFRTNNMSDEPASNLYPHSFVIHYRTGGPEYGYDERHHGESVANLHVDMAAWLLKQHNGSQFASFAGQEWSWMVAELEFVLSGRDFVCILCRWHCSKSPFHLFHCTVCGTHHGRLCINSMPRDQLLVPITHEWVALQIFSKWKGFYMPSLPTALLKGPFKIHFIAQFMVSWWWILCYFDTTGSMLSIEPSSRSLVPIKASTLEEIIHGFHDCQVYKWQSKSHFCVHGSTTCHPARTYIWCHDFTGSTPNNNSFGELNYTIVMERLSMY